MASSGLADLPGSQPLSIDPLSLNTVVHTKLFDLAALGRLEYLLPGKVHAPAIVAKIHDFPGNEPFAHRRRNSFEYAMAIGNGRLAPFLSRLFAIEEKPARPCVGVRIFVV